MTFSSFTFPRFQTFYRSNKDFFKSQSLPTVFMLFGKKNIKVDMTKIKNTCFSKCTKKTSKKILM